MTSWWAETTDAAYAAEVARLAKYGFTKLVNPAQDTVLDIWRGTVNVDLGLARPLLAVTFDILYRRGYPWVHPYVLPVNPAYSRRQHQQRPAELGGPSKFTEFHNRLCIWGEHSDDWNPDNTLLDIIDAVHGWVRATELGWETRGKEEAAVLDLERYFSVARNRWPLYLPCGFSGLQGDIGQLGVAIFPERGIRVLKQVNGINVAAYGPAVAALQAGAVGDEQLVPYVRLPAQPQFPLFSDVDSLIAELRRQRVDVKRLVAAVVQTMPPLAASGEVVVAYPALGQQVGCGLSYGLKRKVDGFRPYKAPSRVVLKASRQSELRGYSTTSLDSDSLLQRNPRRWRVTAIRDAVVTVLGLGSIGSSVAELLTKAGVGSLLLVDADRLEAGNVMRHACGLESVGEAKSRAVRDRLLSFRPDGNFEILKTTLDDEETEFCPIEQNFDLLEEACESSSLVIDCTANVTVGQLASLECYQRGKPFVRAQTFLTGRIGEILYMRPGYGCVACLDAEIYDNHPTIRMPVPPNPESAMGEGCASTTEPASAAALAVTCALAASAVIDILLKGDVGWTVRIWVSEGIPEAVSGSIYAVGPQVYQLAVDPRQRCAVCR